MTTTRMGSRLPAHGRRYADPEDEAAEASGIGNVVRNPWTVSNASERRTLLLVAWPGRPPRAVPTI